MLIIFHCHCCVIHAQVPLAFKELVSEERWLVECLECIFLVNVEPTRILTPTPVAVA